MQEEEGYARGRRVCKKEECMQKGAGYAGGSRVCKSIQGMQEAGVCARGSIYGITEGASRVCKNKQGMQREQGRVCKREQDCKRGGTGWRGTSCMHLNVFWWDLEKRPFRLKGQGHKI